MPAILWTALALAAFILWLIAPASRRPDATALTGRLYAHRGLHDGNHSAPENSLTAFRLAVEAGYGIELDVQRTGDGRLVVHHDSNTRRVCGVAAEILATPYAALPPLPDGSPIPLFDEVLALVAGHAPLIVEIKPYGSATATAAATLDALQRYTGPYCVESFHPLAIRYVRRHAPEVLRGQLAMGTPFNPAETKLAEHLAIKYLLVNAFSRPHFVAYSSNDDHNLSLWLMKRLFHPLLAAWTLRDQAALDRARKDYSMLIFEHFTPDAR